MKKAMFKEIEVGQVFYDYSVRPYAQYIKVDEDNAVRLTTGEVRDVYPTFWMLAGEGVEGLHSFRKYSGEDPTTQRPLGRQTVLRMGEGLVKKHGFTPQQVAMWLQALIDCDLAEGKFDTMYTRIMA